MRAHLTMTSSFSVLPVLLKTRVLHNFPLHHFQCMCHFSAASENRPATAVQSMWWAKQFDNKLEDCGLDRANSMPLSSWRAVSGQLLMLRLCCPREMCTFKSKLKYWLRLKAPLWFPHLPGLDNYVMCKINSRFSNAW